MMNQIERLQAALTKEFPALATSIDPPVGDHGSYFLDIPRPGLQPIVVEWRPDRGFGVSTPTSDDYGDGADEIHSGVTDTCSRVAALIRSGGMAGYANPVRLADLRQLRGLSQTELAERAGVKQANISRIEGRNDVLMSTLAKLADAMGGSLSIHVKFEDGKDCELAVSSNSSGKIERTPFPLL